MKRPAVGYIRVSTARQAGEGVSLDAQREKIIAHCKMHDLDLIEIFADEGLSGKRTDNRPGLQKAVAMACKKKAVLVAYSISRLARSTRDCLETHSRLSKYGADLSIINEQVDTTTIMGRFVFRLMASLAELESEQISERTCMALAYKRQNGERTGSIPYGYRVSSTGTLEPDPDEQAVLDYIYRRAREGAGPKRIATELNKAKMFKRNGKPWFRSGVWSILNPEKRRKSA